MRVWGDEWRAEHGAPLPSMAWRRPGPVAASPGSPPPPTQAGVISRNVRAGPMAAKDSLQEHGFNYSSSGLSFAASPSARQGNLGGGEGAGQAG